MSTPALKITVFGAGSVGCYVGGQLVHAGAQVCFIGRTRYQKDLTEHGLTLTHYARDTVHIAADKIDFQTEAANLQDADVVLVTVKSRDTEEAGRTLNERLNRDALVISLQNGVDNADRLRRAMPAYNVLAGMVPFNVTGTGPGAFHCGTEGDLCIESDTSATLIRLQEAFLRSGQGCVLSPNIAAVQWGKLLINLNNALNTLAGNTLYAGLMQRDYRRALALMVEEALCIVSHAGIHPEKFGKATPEKMIRILRLPNWLYGVVMNRVLKIDTSARSSMLDDLETGRESEIDYLQGAIVRLARKTGQEAPINASVLRKVKEAFAKGESPRMTGSDIWGFVVAGKDQAWPPSA